MQKTLLVLFALLCFSLIALGRFQSDTSDIVPSERTLRIGVSTSLLSSPIIIAERLGFFSAQNIEVLLVPFKGGNACFNAMIRQDVDLATSSDSVIMFNSLQRDDFAVIASFAESDNDLKLLTRGDENLTELSQLDGKRIGMVMGSASQYFFDTVLDMNDAQLTTTNINLAPNEQGAALMANAVDAISSWEPYAYKLHQSYPSKIHKFNTKGLYSISFNLLIQKHQSVQFQEELVQLLKALEQANEYILAHPQQAQTYVAQYLKVPLNEVQTLWPDYLFRLSLDNALVSNLNSQARWAIHRKLTERTSPPDYRLFIDPTALNQALHKPLVRTK